MGFSKQLRYTVHQHEQTNKKKDSIVFIPLKKKR